MVEGSLFTFARHRAGFTFAASRCDGNIEGIEESQSAISIQLTTYRWLSWIETSRLEVLPNHIESLRFGDSGDLGYWDWGMLE